MADTLQPVINSLKKSMEETAKEFDGFKQEAGKVSKEFGDALSKNADKIGDAMVRTDETCLLYTSPSPRDLSTSRMPSSA